jgi:RND family efflux transporter MFP subunit
MQTVVLSAPVSAVVESVLVRRGEFVEKGQIVAILESNVEKATVAAARARAEGRAELEAAEARRAFERSRHERSTELRQGGVLSALEQDERKSALLVAEADHRLALENRKLAKLDLRRAEALLERRTTRSPIDGVVVRRILNPGEYADPLDLLELAQIDPLRVEAFAPVAMLGRVRVDMLGDVSLEEPVGGEHEAKVVVVDPVVDAASGTFGVRLELSNRDHRLPAGLKCHVVFREAPAASEAGETAEHRDGAEADPG